MRIIYSAGNRIGANEQLSRFLNNIKNHQVKIAAYNKSSYSIPHVDWMLDGLFLKSGGKIEYLFSDKKINIILLYSLLKDVIKFNPDLIISDDDDIFIHIANELNIKLWTCGPINMLNGLYWVDRIIYSHSFFRYKAFKPINSGKHLIYSPFCDIKNSPEIKKEYTWVRPYYNEYKNVNIEEYDRFEKLNLILNYVKKNDYCFTDGNTDSISDSIYNNKKILISPNVNNIEALINSLLIEKYNIGYNLGQVELMNFYAVNEIEQAYNRTYNEIELNNSQHLQLHEMIEEYYRGI